MKKMSDNLVIDISKWNGKVNFEKVKAAGVYGVMLRAGTGAGTIDPRFIENITACNRLGIPVGVYWFSYATTPTEAELEAAFCVSTIKPYKISLPVAFDWEEDSYKNAKKKGVTVDSITAVSMASRFLHVVQTAGYTPILYTNLDFQSRFFPKTELIGYDRWIAAYRLIKPSGDYAIWQYSDKGRVDGIDGEVDMNRLYKDYIVPMKTNYRNIAKERFGFEEKTMNYLAKYEYADALFERLATKP